MDPLIHIHLKRVRGFTGRQKVNINLHNFDALKKPEREALFDRHIQRYVEYLEHLRDKAVELSMKIIFVAWRTHKYRLKEVHKEGKDPFELYKELD